MAKTPKVKADKTESLLVELLTEELPPKSLKLLSDVFRDEILNGLIQAQLKPDARGARAFATPRRLAVLVPDVLWRARDRTESRKLMPAKVAFDDSGKPTVALLKRLEKLGISARAAGPQIERRSDEDNEYVYINVKIPGAVLPAALLGKEGILNNAIAKLPIDKRMRWGQHQHEFVRPVHGLVVVHGSKVVPVAILGLKSSNKTLGHRFLSKGAVTLKHARDYQKTLKTRGRVIASFEDRRTAIEKDLDKAAAKLGSRSSWRLGKETDLLDEVTSIVEFPRVYAGSFDAAFLAVPRECLIVSMQQHQKYFPLADAKGRLQPRFLFVANMSPPNPVQIIRGNERVLRARLSDAKFFYDQDRKTKLAERVPRLADVVYHNKLGNQLERVQRLQKLSGHIAALLQADVPSAERAAYLSKGDLLTAMVGEFPELQGVMGRYYALHDGESPAVADAVEQHYFPRSAGGVLPDGPIALAISLADKLDALVGMFGIGLAPSGDKDPFGLRRAAVGVVRMLVEKRLALDLKELVERARSLATQAPMAPNVVQQVQEFMFDRLRSYLRDSGYAPDEIEAVLALKPTRLDQIPSRLDAIKKFRALPEGMALAAANKRIHNILRQAGKEIKPSSDGSLLQEDAEKELANRLGEIMIRVAPMVVNGDYTDALKELATLRAPVDAFFDRVMVMVEDENLRLARLQLLARIHHEFRQIADIGRLQS